MKRTGVVMAVFFLLFVSTVVSADTFSAKTINDFGNVTVMEVTGNYDANNPDGTVNADSRQTITKEFYRTHKDEYDFLVFSSNFDFKMPDNEVKAFYLHIKNDTQA